MAKIDNIFSLGTIGIVRVDAYVLNWLQKTLLRSAMRGAETEFSMKLVHRRRGIADLALRVPPVSQF